MKYMLLIIFLLTITLPVYGADATTVVEDAWNKYVVGAIAGGSVSGLAQLGWSYIGSEINKKKKQQWDNAINQANTLNANATTALSKFDALAKEVVDKVDITRNEMVDKVDIIRNEMVAVKGEFKVLSDNVTTMQDKFKAGAEALNEKIKNSQDA